MSQTREDVANAKTALIVSLDRWAAILKNHLAAVENCKRAVMMTTAQIPEVDVLTLDTPDAVEKQKNFVRDLAGKIAAVGQSGNGG